MRESIVSAEWCVIKHLPKIVDQENKKRRNNQKSGEVFRVSKIGKPAINIQINHSEKPIEKKQSENNF